MTLKEFTKVHINADTEDGQKPRWRQVFPLELRFEERFVKFRFFRSDLTKMVLQSHYERIHKGDVIDTTWRDVPTEYLPYYDF